MILTAGCKINIGLDVIAKRVDGFHELETLMFPVKKLCDVVEVVRSGNPGVQFSCSGLAVDVQAQDNQCVRAYELMRERYRIGGVRIHLHKAVPFGAGLGGGSSDATAVLKACNELFGLELNDEKLELLAAELGSDTAFFVRNEPAIATGRGELLETFPIDLSGKYLLIVKPDIKISTAEAYSEIVPRMPELPLRERLKEGIDKWQKTIVNDFESHIFKKYPKLKEIKNKMEEAGALYAAMSGSGSAIYGIFESELNIDFQEDTLFVYGEII